VTLHFAWPKNLQGSVKHTYETHTDASLPQLKAEVKYRFAVQAADKGLHKMVPSDVQLGDVASALTVGEPSIVLFDGRGAFKGIEHTKGDMLDRMTDLPGLPPLPPEKAAALHKQIEELMRSDAQEKWDELTGRWDGVTLTPGKPSKRTVKLRLGSFVGALMPGGQAEVESNEVTTIETEVACEAVAEKACARITVETNPAKPSPPKPDMMGMIEKKATKKVVIVLEPTTLVPHSIHLERADVVERDGTTERHLQLDDVVFSYGAPGGRKL
jgi:hypothetical protein